jgi:hypothetical protein
MKFYCAYLPQFHECEGNNFFWGKGFTDWVKTKNARSYFKDHQQPRKPGNLGYYNLTNKRILLKHAMSMKKFDIDAFGVYYYHFDKKIFALNKPLEIVRKNKNIPFKYYLYWVNSDWTKSWVGEDKTTIYKQNNSLNHAIYVIKNSIKYFKDKRYEKIDNRPVLFINDIDKFDCELFKKKANDILNRHNIKNLYLVGNLNYIKNKNNFKYCDAVINWPPDSLFLGRIKNFLRFILPTLLLKINILFKFLSVQNYQNYLNLLNLKILDIQKKHKNFIPTYINDWDNTPRYKEKGILLDKVNPKIFYQKIKSIAPQLKKNKTKAIFFKAWNEWAEGNVIENSEKYGDDFMICLKKIKKLFI